GNVTASARLIAPMTAEGHGGRSREAFATPRRMIAAIYWRSTRLGGTFSSHRLDPDLLSSNVFFHCLLRFHPATRRCCSEQASAAVVCNALIVPTERFRRLSGSVS
ncbi:MAG: hypothetical protein E6575_13980, partial [Bradyrhizobium sp.]|nr:hypothetical protein [Bradyrhizobium sp.]